MMQYTPQDIQNIQIFKGLNGEQRLALFEIARKQQFSGNTTIVREGEKGISLYAILAGSVRVTKGIKGELEHLATLVVGDCFGEMALLEGLTRSATVTTLEETILLEFDMKALDQLFERQPQIAHRLFRNLARILSMRLRHFQERVQEISWRSDSF